MKNYKIGFMSILVISLLIIALLLVEEKVEATRLTTPKIKAENDQMCVGLCEWGEGQCIKFCHIEKYKTGRCELPLGNCCCYNA
ncbi:hypothetical protein AALP_AA3G086400 [Arabis alpina]|uniref:Uncharacterized protein n=1 Tax=Arabis alpina TaxID=50452 RepID=A0A087H7Y1_ARAAL|nr:hypothetical protein AALP_AA3G086400 [Arabis alpina]